MVIDDGLVANFPQRRPFGSSASIQQKQCEWALHCLPDVTNTACLPGLSRAIHPPSKLDQRLLICPICESISPSPPFPPISPLCVQAHSLTDWPVCAITIATALDLSLPIVWFTDVLLRGLVTTIVYLPLSERTRHCQRARLKTETQLPFV